MTELQEPRPIKENAENLLSAIKAAMREHSSLPKVQSAACWAMATLTFFTAGDDEAQRLGLRDAPAMARHETEPSVQSSGCEALGNILFQMPPIPGLLSRLRRSIHRHPNDARLLVSGFRAICNALESQTGINHCEEGLIEELMSHVVDNASDGNLQVRLAYSIGKFCSGNSSYSPSPSCPPSPSVPQEPLLSCSPPTPKLPEVDKILPWPLSLPIPPFPAFPLLSIACQHL